MLCLELPFLLVEFNYVLIEQYTFLGNLSLFCSLSPCTERTVPPRPSLAKMGMWPGLAHWSILRPRQEIRTWLCGPTGVQMTMRFRRDFCESRHILRGTWIWKALVGTCWWTSWYHTKPEAFLGGCPARSRWRLLHSSSSMSMSVWRHQSSRKRISKFERKRRRGSFLNFLSWNLATP